MRYQHLGRFLSVTVACLLIIGFTTSNVEARREFVRFGGSNPGGSWFTIVGGLSGLLNKQLPDLNVTPVATGGSTANNRMARNDELDVWLTHSLTAYENYTGTGLFAKEGPFKGYRMMCGVYESWHHFVTLASSDIKTMSDLKGKRVCIGAAGSGAAVNSENILRALGLWDQIKPESLTFDGCGRGLLDGHVDVVSLSSAPMPAIVTVEALKKIRLIPLTDEEIKKVLTKYPAYKKGMMPAGVYKSWDKPYPCIAFQVYLAAHENAKREWIDEILKVLFDPKNKDALASIHRQLKTLSPSLQSLSSLGIPLHPGAIEFWKSKGLSIPQNLIP